MPPPHNHGQPEPDPLPFLNPFRATVFPVTTAPELISTKIPSSQFPETRLFTIVELAAFRSAHSPLHALSWMVEFLTVVLSAVHFTPPPSYPQLMFRFV